MGEALNKQKLFVLSSPSLEENIVGLTFYEVQAVYLSVKSIHENLKNWKIWQEDWSDWMALDEFMSEFKNAFRPMMVEPPVVESNFVIPDFNGSFDDNTRTLVNHTKIIKIDDEFVDLRVEDDSGEYVVRQYSRISKRFKVKIQVDDESFTSYTNDISVGGVFLEDAIPDWVIGYVQVKVVKMKSHESVSLMASVVENQDPKMRYRLTFVPLKSKKDEKQFYNWLVAD